MKGDASVFGNESGTYGGGVYVNSATFNMKGEASILTNKSTSGGGLYVTGNNGIFTMEDSSKVENNQVGSVDGTSEAQGGGVYMSGGRFTMKSGEISDNKALGVSGNTDVNGGGVYVENGTFEMTGGSISGNESTYDGGGVYVFSGSFQIENGIIYGYGAPEALANKATDNLTSTLYGTAYVGKFVDGNFEPTMDDLNPVIISRANTTITVVNGEWSQ